MLTIGDKFPAFNLKAVVSTDPKKAFTDISNESAQGKWKVVFFWPKDFTFVCPTEIAAFGKLNGEFNDRDAVVYGVSTDSEFVHLAWRQNHADLKDLPFPMLADTNRRLSQALGILDEDAGVAKRATFLVDPDGIVRAITWYPMAVGRNVSEILRLVVALQTSDAHAVSTPEGWQPGQPVIDAAPLDPEGETGPYDWYYKLKTL